MTRCPRCKTRFDASIHVHQGKHKCPECHYEFDAVKKVCRQPVPRRAPSDSASDQGWGTAISVIATVFLGYVLAALTLSDHHYSDEPILDTLRDIRVILLVLVMVVWISFLLIAHKLAKLIGLGKPPPA